MIDIWRIFFSTLDISMCIYLKGRVIDWKYLIYSALTIELKQSVSKLLKGLSWSWSYGSWIYNYICNQCLSPLTLWVRTPIRRGVLDTTLYDKVCQWLSTGRWFSYGYPVSSINKTDRHNVNEILLKVVLNTINYPNYWLFSPYKSVLYCTLSVG